MNEAGAGTILNVGNDAACLHARNRILARAGHRVLDADSGEEGLRLAASERPDLVLLTMKLTDMSGPEMCRRLKSGAATAHMMVLHISAKEAGGRTEAEASEAVADASLTEPVDANELVATVNALLRVRSREAANRRLIERLQYGLDSADMVAWDWNPDSDVMIQSPNAGRVLGLPEGTTLQSSKEYFALMHQEDEPRVVAAIQRALREGRDYHEEFRVVLSDGSVRWVADRGRVTMSEQGKAARMNGVIRDITELKMRDIAVRESEARFRAMFHQAAVGMCLISPEGHLLQVNQKLCVLLGEEADALIHRKLLDLTYSEDRPHNQTSMSRLLLGGAADVSIEQRLVRRDGRSVWVSMYLALLWDVGGRLEHIIGVIQDIDERKQAEEALRESDRRFREMIDALPAAVYTTDIEGRLTHFNPAAVELSGRTPLLGTDQWCVSWKLYRPDGTLLPREECPMAVALKENRTVRGAEAIGERPDGTRVWFTPYPMPLRDTDGRVVGGINMLVDITERKQAEEALRESELRFRNMADTAPAMLWKTDVSGACTFLSRAWYDFTGQAPDTGLGHGRFGQVHPDDRERVLQLFQTAIARREPFSVDYRLRCADGGYRWASDTGRPRVPRSGEFQGYIGSIIDITERKQAETQLHLLNADLERRVADRTRDLLHSQNRLRKLASDLSVAEERERRRVAGELHDYLAQLLVATRMKLSQGRQARSSVKQAEVLNEVDHMLDQSLTYTRTLVAQLSPPVLHEFGLPAALKWLGEQMPRHGLTVVSTIDAASVDLTENQSVLLFQSARELLLNVVKHAGTDQARLRLEFKNGDLRLTVTDEGQGFDASGSKETAVFRNAFGLFSIRERMESLGGMVEVTSRPGKGTRVTLIMPLSGDEKNSKFQRLSSTLTGNPQLRIQAADLRQSRSPIPTHAQHVTQQSELHQGLKFRVLLVDDHAMVRQGLRSLLENHRDVEVVAEAGDGLDAITLADKLRPDVVVMDLSLPSLDGVEATRQICHAHPSTVVIGLSVHQTHQVEQAIRAAGAAAFLTKDCAVDQLYEAISSAMMARST
ncbi:MAG: PAS domain S-box protein [Nitrospiraceae bacterium]